MNIAYRRTSTTVSKINYHFVFCPRYRRKIFLIDGVETRFKELVRQICEANDIMILAMECHIDHVHLFLNAPPKMSPSDIMKVVKQNTSRALRMEFGNFFKSPTIWTRSYFVSTAGDVSSDMIEKYVNSQKIRG